MLSPLSPEPRPLPLIQSISAHDPQLFLDNFKKPHTLDIFSPLIKLVVVIQKSYSEIPTQDFRILKSQYTSRGYQNINPSFWKLVSEKNKTLKYVFRSQVQRETIKVGILKERSAEQWMVLLRTKPLNIHIQQTGLRKGNRIIPSNSTKYKKYYSWQIHKFSKLRTKQLLLQVPLLWIKKD